MVWLRGVCVYVPRWDVSSWTPTTGFSRRGTTTLPEDSNTVTVLAAHGAFELGVYLMMYGLTTLTARHFTLSRTLSSRVIILHVDAVPST